MKNLKDGPVFQSISVRTGPLYSSETFQRGIENTSMEETIVELELVDGKLRLISKSSNKAMVHAVMQVTSEELKATGDKTLEYDLDLDGNPDRLSCSYWERWGAVSCTLTSSKHGEILISGGCNRIGILPTTTNKHAQPCLRSFGYLKLGQ